MAFTPTQHDFQIHPGTAPRHPAENGAIALRDMLHPDQSYNPQPLDMASIPEEYSSDCQSSSNNDNCGVHLINSIPNRAAALMLSSINWDDAAPLFYRVMVSRLRSSSDFADYAAQLRDECPRQLDPSQCHIVEESLADVGL